MGLGWGRKKTGGAGLLCSGVVLGFVALVDVLHLPVDLADGVGAQAQAGGILLGEFAVGFIPQLVLQTGPHIHGDGAELDLHRQDHGALADDEGHVDDQVQAAVTGVLGLLDIVHLAEDGVGLAAGEQGAQVVDIIQIVADDADTGHVLDVGVDVVDADLQAPAAQLVDDAVQRLDTVLDVVDGRVVIQAGELLVQDLHLRYGYLQRTAVQVRHPHHARRQLLVLRGKARGGGNVPQADGTAFFDHHGQTPSFRPQPTSGTAVSSYYTNMTCL